MQQRFWKEKKTHHVRKKRLRTARDRVLNAANTFIVRHCPIGTLGASPIHVVVGTKRYWIVLIMLTSPGIGEVGSVGTVVLDGRTLKVISCTNQKDIQARVRQLKKTRAARLETAFRSVRTV